jgi:hypothetical protein
LLYLPIIGVIALVLGSWEQSSENVNDAGSCHCSLALAAGAVWDRSWQRRFALTPRMTQGILGGHTAARCAHELST